MLLLSPADFFSKLTFSKKSFRNTIRVSNGLDPDQDQRSVGPDLGPNCLQRFTADEKSCITVSVTLLLMSRDMRFPTMWCVRPAKAQLSLC